MSTNFVTLLDTINTSGSFVSEKQPGAGYHRQVSNVHTFILSFNNFIGNVKLQGTLEIFPGEKDWFTLKNTSNEDIVFVNPDTIPFNLATRGNFMWIRAVGTLESGEITSIRFAI